MKISRWVAWNIPGKQTNNLKSASKTLSPPMHINYKYQPKIQTSAIYTNFISSVCTRLN